MSVVAHPLAVYLRNHEAAQRAGHDLFRRVVANQACKPYAEDLRQLTDDVHDDLHALQDFMTRAGVSPDPVLVAALRLGERLGRLKPNGSLVFRAPLTDLIEIEGLLGAVSAKAAAWQALSAAGVDAWAEPLDVGVLIDRASAQTDRLQEIHRSVAAVLLARV